MGLKEKSKVGTLEERILPSVSNKTIFAIESEPPLWADDENTGSSDQQAEKKVKRRRTSFESLTTRSKRKRTDELIKVLKEFVSDECDDQLVIDPKALTINQLLGYCLH